MTPAKETIGLYPWATIWGHKFNIMLERSARADHLDSFNFGAGVPFAQVLTHRPGPNVPSAS